jgi:DNA-binding NtrC family response regulator
MTGILDCETEILPLLRRHVVILVDDDLSTLRSLERLLGHEPYEVRTTFRPEQALAWVSQSDISLVLADHHMPDMSGTEMLTGVRQIAPGTMCVMLTAFKDRLFLSEEAKSWVREVIEKPWDNRHLKKTIRNLLRERELKEDHRLPEEHN